MRLVTHRAPKIGLGRPGFSLHRENVSDRAIVGKLLADAKDLLNVDQKSACVLLQQAVVLLQNETSPVYPEGRARGMLASWQINRVSAYIDANLAAEMRTCDLATVAGLSVSHFTRAFKNAFGSTPKSYIVKKRVAAACSTMLETKEPLTKIAYALGFCDQSHFSRTFQLQTGMSPNEWRQAHTHSETHGRMRPRISACG